MSINYLAILNLFYNQNIMCSVYAELTLERQNFLDSSNYIICSIFYWVAPTFILFVTCLFFEFYD